MKLVCISLFVLLKFASGQIGPSRRLKAELFHGYDGEIRPDNNITVGVSLSPKCLDLQTDGTIKGSVHSSHLEQSWSNIFGMQKETYIINTFW